MELGFEVGSTKTLLPLQQASNPVWACLFHFGFIVLLGRRAQGGCASSTWRRCRWPTPRLGSEDLRAEDLRAALGPIIGTIHRLLRYPPLYHPYPTIMAKQGLIKVYLDLISGWGWYRREYLRILGTIWVCKGLLDLIWVY